MDFCLIHKIVCVSISSRAARAGVPRGNLPFMLVEHKYIIVISYKLIFLPVDYETVRDHFNRNV